MESTGSSGNSLLRFMRYMIKLPSSYWHRVLESLRFKLLRLPSEVGLCCIEIALKTTLPAKKFEVLRMRLGFRCLSIRFL